jgi:diguanylate cyclase (GGDEF)-like protein
MTKKVLLVENDTAIRIILSESLEHAGYDVLQAESGKMALSMLENRDISIILSARFLPDMDGLQLCRRIKVHPDSGAVYFIVTATKEERDQGMESSDSGVDDFLSKPVDEGELLMRVKVGERFTAQQKNMENLACVDPLTCLRNKRAFDYELESEIARLKRYKQAFSLLLVEIDNINSICDELGPAGRDSALRLFGKFLLSNLRLSDYTYRVADSRFSVILPQIKELDAEKAISRLKGAFSAFMSEHKGEIPKNLSFIIGSVAIQDNSILSREQIVNAAEKIMYLDKKRNLDSESHHMAEMVENKGTVLVVDDEPVIRMILQRSLSSAGYKVLLAEDGESCLEILKREEPEVLILDWILPNMDGMDVCRKVREDQLAKPPYIIVMTIIRGAKSRIHALNTGADDYASKPIDVDELLARVRVGMRIEALKRQIARAEKLEGVMQMAGAVAHELSQPLTALMGLADLALMRMDASDQNYRHIAQIVELAQRLGDLVKKIGSIMKYETMDYVGHTKIVDIDKASKRNAVKDADTTV